MSDFIPAAKPIIGEREVAAVTRVLLSGMLTQGPEVAAFETEFAAHFSLDRPCVAVNSGTSGLHLGLLAAGVGAGDEVIVPSFTFAATANAVALTGAKPVFADIEPDSFCLSPAAVEAAVTPRTVGMMPVHLYGHPADMTALQAVADRHGLEVFEDAAQAHGASWRGQPVGSLAAWGVFSLYPTKNMTSGEGGIVSCATAETERLVRLYRNQGMQRRYHHEVVGLNNRMTDIHAAIGRVQLGSVDEWTAKRQRNAAFLSAHLRGVVTPSAADDAVHVYHQYTVRVPEDRDGFAQALEREYRIGTGMFYPVPIHRLAPFAAGAGPGGAGGAGALGAPAPAPDLASTLASGLPETERAARECLSLPVHPSVSQADLERIAEAVNALAKAGA